jgi:hypothetical protein
MMTRLYVDLIFYSMQMELGSEGFLVVTEVRPKEVDAARLDPTTITVAVSLDEFSILPRDLCFVDVCLTLVGCRSYVLLKMLNVRMLDYTGSLPG